MSRMTKIVSKNRPTGHVTHLAILLEVQIHGTKRITGIL